MLAFKIMRKKVLDCSVWDLIAYCEQREVKYGMGHCCEDCQFFNKKKGFCPVSELYERTQGFDGKSYDEIVINPYTHG